MLGRRRCWVIVIVPTLSDGDDRLYERDTVVRRPLAEVVRCSDDGVPHQRPEATLLLEANYLASTRFPGVPELVG